MNMLMADVLPGSVEFDLVDPLAEQKILRCRWSDGTSSISFLVPCKNGDIELAQTEAMARLVLMVYRNKYKSNPTVVKAAIRAAFSDEAMDKDRLNKASVRLTGKQIQDLTPSDIDYLISVYALRQKVKEDDG